MSNIPADAAARQAAPAVICYPTTDLPQPDMVNLERARTNLTKISEIIVPPRDARCFDVQKGHFFRITSIDGPQVGDLNIWSKALPNILRGKDTSNTRNAPIHRRPHGPAFLLCAR